MERRSAKLVGEGYTLIASVRCIIDCATARLGNATVAIEKVMSMAASC